MIILCGQRCKQKLKRTVPKIRMRIVTADPKRQPGRPRNAELLERLASSHRQPEPGADAIPATMCSPSYAIWPKLQLDVNACRSQAKARTAQQCRADRALCQQPQATRAWCRRHSSTRARLLIWQQARKGPWEGKRQEPPSISNCGKPFDRHTAQKS